MRKTIRVAVSTVLVAVSCYPGHTLADNSDANSEPPNIPLDLAVESPSFVTPVIGKSLEARRQELQDAENERKRLENEKKQAQERAKRTNRTPGQETPEIRRSEQKQAEYVRIIGKSNEECVIYYKRMSGKTGSLGNAGNIKPQGYEPKIGAGALERSYGHISLVIAIDGDYLVLRDTNWIKGAVTERRVHKSTQRGYIY